jgi:hypothetical protein
MTNEYKYFSVARGKFRYTKAGIPKFETDSGLVARGFSVADMLKNIAVAHPDFFHLYEGVTWKEITKEQADKMIGKDIDIVCDKEYGKRRKRK